MNTAGKHKNAGCILVKPAETQDWWSCASFMCWISF